MLSKKIFNMLMLLLIIFLCLGFLFLRYSEPKDKLISYSEETIGLPLAWCIEDARGRIDKDEGYLTAELKVSSDKRQEVLRFFEDKYKDIEVKEGRVLFQYTGLHPFFSNLFKAEDLTAKKTYSLLRSGKSNSTRDIWIQFVTDSDNVLWLYILG